MLCTVEHPLAERWVRYSAVHQYSPRRDFQVCSVDQGTFLFGGDSADGPCNDVYTYDWASDEWRLVHVDAVKPSQRSGHSLVEWNGFICLFGGKGVGKFLCDLWRFDPPSGLWRMLHGEVGAPRGRWGHVMVVDEDQRSIILHGGTSTHTLNDVWRYNLVLASWTKESEETGIATSCEHDRNIPQARFWHTGCIWESQLYIFGGRSSTPLATFGDVWAFHPQGKNWCHVETRGAAPLPRYGHVGIRVGDRWLIHGGRRIVSIGDECVSTRSLFELHLGASTWSAVRMPHSSPPLPRLSWHAGCCVVSRDMLHKIVLTGGWDETNRRVNTTIWVNACESGLGKGNLNLRLPMSQWGNLSRMCTGPSYPQEAVLVKRKTQLRVYLDDPPSTTLDQFLKYKKKSPAQRLRASLRKKGCPTKRRLQTSPIPHEFIPQEPKKQTKCKAHDDHNPIIVSWNPLHYNCVIHTPTDQPPFPEDPALPATKATPAYKTAQAQHGSGLEPHLLAGEISTRGVSAVDAAETVKVQRNEAEQESQSSQTRSESDAQSGSHLYHLYLEYSPRAMPKTTESSMVAP